MTLGVTQKNDALKWAWPAGAEKIELYELEPDATIGKEHLESFLAQHKPIITVDKGEANLSACGINYVAKILLIPYENGKPLFVSGNLYEYQGKRTCVTWVNKEKLLPKTKLFAKQKSHTILIVQCSQTIPHSVLAYKIGGILYPLPEIIGNKSWEIPCAPKELSLTYGVDAQQNQRRYELRKGGSL